MLDWFWCSWMFWSNLFLAFLNTHRRQWNTTSSFLGNAPKVCIKALPWAWNGKTHPAINFKRTWTNSWFSEMTSSLWFLYLYIISLHIATKHVDVWNIPHLDRRLSSLGNDHFLKRHRHGMGIWATPAKNLAWCRWLVPVEVWKVAWLQTCEKMEPTSLPRRSARCQDPNQKHKERYPHDPQCSPQQRS